MATFTERLKAYLGYGGYDDGTPIAIGGNAQANDLRYGSELVTRPIWPAAPGLYGLHSSVTPGFVKTPDGKTVSYAALYATQPWVFATVMKYRTLMQVVPPKVYRRDEVKGRETRVRLRAKDHPLAAAVAHPWRGADGNDLVDSILASMLIHGNAAVEVESGPGESIRFTPLDWRSLTPQQVASHYISGWTFEDEAFDESRTITMDNMVHVAWSDPCGPLGISPLSALGVTLSSEIAAQLYGINNLKNGAPGGRVAIRTDAEFFGGLEQEERDAILADMRTQIAERYTGIGNVGIPALLPPGMSWDSVEAHTAQEAVLIEQRKLNREEVEGVYLMPPPLVGQLDKATYSNIDTQKEMGYQDTLAPQAVKIAKALNTQVAYELLGDDEIYVEIDLSGVLQGNAQQRMANYSAGFNIGVYSPNEVRARENLDRIDEPWADKHYLPGNNVHAAENVADAKPDASETDTTGT